MATIETIQELIQRCPIIDNHCHNLVDNSCPRSFESFYTEAEGMALEYSTHTVHFKRSIREVSGILQTEATIEAVKTTRNKLGVEAMARTFLEASNLTALLIDDGLVVEKMFPVAWHEKFVPAVYRVLRIEVVAQDIINRGPPGSESSWTLQSFEKKFLEAIDPIPAKVVSFKSIIAYRSGLKIDPQVSRSEAELGLLETVAGAAGQPVRLVDKRILDFVFVKSLEVATKHNVPLQIHTGFGDKDLELLLSNPLHLQKVLEDDRFSNSKLVLLHTSYPYMREAGFLCLSYSQVYLDLGLVFHTLTNHGAVSACRSLLESAPLNKIMYSSDAVGVPELFYIAARAGRRYTAQILSDLCRDDDLTVHEALTAACDILYNTANQLYALKLPPVTPQGVLQVAAPGGTLPLAARKSKAVRMLFTDVSGQRRCRVIPTPRYDAFVSSAGTAITHAHMGMTSYCDAPAEGCQLSGTGEVRLVGDASTRVTLPWFPDHEVVLASAHVTPGVPWAFCPRSCLIRLATQLQDEFGLEMRAGFESEFYLLKETTPSPVPLDQTPYCSSHGYDISADIIQEIVDSIESLGISVEQTHEEGGPGQFEISAIHFPALQSADKITLLREAVTAVAARRALRATFLPSVFPDQLASGGHVHLSITRNGSNVFGEQDAPHGMSEEGRYWLAGVLSHLPAVIAITAPHPNSYARLQPNMWAGAFQCWGHENKEASLRTNTPPGVAQGLVTNFEIKSADAMANPHLLLAAIMAAGMDGLRRKLPLPGPVNVNPADLPAGAVNRLPSSLEEAVEELIKDKVLKEAFGEELFQCIVAVRTAEAAHYKGMPYVEMVQKIIHKY